MGEELICNPTVQDALSRERDASCAGEAIDVVVIFCRRLTLPSA